MDRVPASSWLHRTGVRIRSLIGYPRFRRACLRRPVPGEEEVFAPQREAALNLQLRRTISNHQYRLVRRHLVPSFQLYERLRLVARAYPQPLGSFLDIGCCHGFYVMDAVARWGCPRAVGIDVYEPFVATAREVAQYLRLQEAAFNFASLQQVSDNPPQFGGPFQAVLLIGTYHYLFWGSDRCPTAYYDHEEIFRRLASLCADRLIVSGRLTMARAFRVIADRLQSGRGDPSTYTTQAFLRSAGKFFTVQHAGYLGVDPLFVMTKRTRLIPPLSDGTIRLDATAGLPSPPYPCGGNSPGSPAMGSFPEGRIRNSLGCGAARRRGQCVGKVEPDWQNIKSISFGPDAGAGKGVLAEAFRGPQRGSPRGGAGSIRGGF